MESFKLFLKSIVPLSDQEFENYSQYFKSHRLPKNSYFALQGKICQEVAFIKKGTLRIYYTNENPRK